MAAAALPPVEHYTFFLKSLLETVRVNIGECAAASYSVLTIEAATEILMFNDEKVLSALMSSRTLSLCQSPFNEFTPTVSS
jgi:CSN8/PSMD8/EIF3K family